MLHVKPNRPHKAPRKYAFLLCGPLDFESAVEPHKMKNSRQFR